MQSISGKKPDGRAQCPDCKMCLQCSESRCSACRNGAGKKRQIRMSISDQIALYERLNSQIGTRAIHEDMSLSRCTCGSHGERVRENETEQDQ